MKRETALRIVCEFARVCGGEKERAAVAVLEAKKAAKSGEVSARGLAFADWFRSTLSGSPNLSPNWREVWGGVFDLMMTRDGRTDADIFAVCKWARGHAFWSGVFLSPAKLRERKDGVMYFDRFAEAMRTAGKGVARRVQPAGFAIAETEKPRAVSALELRRQRGQ